MDNITQFIDFDFKHKWRSVVGDVFTLLILGVALLYLGEVIRTRILFNPFFNDKFIVESPDAIKITAFFLLLVLLFGLVKLAREGVKNRRLLKDSKYEFKHGDWPNKWVFNGKTEILSGIDQLYVKSSRAGCLLKTHLWKNFRMTFEMKFEPSLMQYRGIVFRADDLDNYFMLEIFRDHLGSSDDKQIWESGIKPHVRYKGGWEIIWPEKYNQLDFSDFEQVALEALEDTVTLFYKQQPLFKWVLPTYVDVNHVEAGFKSVMKDDTKEKVDIIGKNVTRVVQEIPFRLNYGMVGFRAHPGQGAIIRDLKVEPL